MRAGLAAQRQRRANADDAESQQAHHAVEDLAASGARRCGAQATFELVQINVRTKLCGILTHGAPSPYAKRRRRGSCKARRRRWKTQRISFGAFTPKTDSPDARTFVNPDTRASLAQVKC